MDIAKIFMPFSVGSQLLNGIGFIYKFDPPGWISWTVCSWALQIAIFPEWWVFSGKWYGDWQRCCPRKITGWIWQGLVTCVNVLRIRSMTAHHWIAGSLFPKAENVAQLHSPGLLVPLLKRRLTSVWLVYRFPLSRFQNHQCEILTLWLPKTKKCSWCSGLLLL